MTTNPTTNETTAKPENADVAVGTFTVNRLAAALRATIPCASADVTREHLNTVALAFRKSAGFATLLATTTDGHALIEAEIVAQGELYSMMHNAKGRDVRTLLRIADAKTLLAALKYRRAERKQTVTVWLSSSEIRVRTHKGSELRYAAYTDMPFPPIDQVMPRRRYDGERTESKAASIVGVAPRLMQRIGKAGMDFARDTDAVCVGFEVAVGKGDLDPIRLDYSHHNVGDLRVVLMPMRIGK